jgi:calnexin
MKFTSFLAVVAASIALVSAHEDHHDHDGHDHDHDHHHGKPSKKAVVDDDVEVALPEAPPHPQVPEELLKKLEFLETFQEGSNSLEKGWVVSLNERYAGHEWLVANTFAQKDDGSDFHYSAFKDEMALGVHVKHKHYGLTHVLDRPFDNTNNTLVFQYETRFHDGLSCSGSYVKLLVKQEKLDPLDLKEATPYVIMFGPDRCASTNKVHFIVRQKQPDGSYQEKHMAKSIGSKFVDTFSHLYTLVIKPDNSFKVLIDGQIEASGSFLKDSDFVPPFGSQEEIDDPVDFKPKDWVDEATMPDPEAVKPADWNEDAPATIPDPDASKPKDWNDEDDGIWMPPSIPNPEFKGKWKHPMVPNPAYIGEWKRKKIPNPYYFIDEQPANLQPIGAIALEILANDRGIAFDNILLTHDELAAEEYAYLTFHKKKTMEKSFIEAMNKAKAKKERIRAFHEDGVYGKLVFWWGEAVELFWAHMIKTLITLGLLVVGGIFFCCAGSSTPSERDDHDDHDHSSPNHTHGSMKSASQKAAPSKSTKVEEENNEDEDEEDEDENEKSKTGKKGE